MNTPQELSAGLEAQFQAITREKEVGKYLQLLADYGSFVHEFALLRLAMLPLYRQARKDSAAYRIAKKNFLDLTEDSNEKLKAYHRMLEEKQAFLGKREHSVWWAQFNLLRLSAAFYLPSWQKEFLDPKSFTDYQFIHEVNEIKSGNTLELQTFKLEKTQNYLTVFHHYLSKMLQNGESLAAKKDNTGNLTVKKYGKDEVFFDLKPEETYPLELIYTNGYVQMTGKLLHGEYVQLFNVAKHAKKFDRLLKVFIPLASQAPHNPLTLQLYTLAEITRHYGDENLATSDMDKFIPSKEIPAICISLFHGIYQHFIEKITPTIYRFCPILTAQAFLALPAAEKETLFQEARKILSSH